MEEIIENRLVYCADPVLESVGSSRISRIASDHEVYPVDVEIDFTVCESLDEVLDGLRHMNEIGVHIMGSRGYVYSSKVLAKILEEIIDNEVYHPLTCFPRTFGLRATIREIIIK